MDPTLITEMVKQYGFPIVSSVGMGYFVYFIYTFVTTKLMPIIGETNTILVALIDRIRMLDNDMIRLQQKVNVILQMREEGTINANQDKTGSIKTPKP
jgi:hypothetical protein